MMVKKIFILALLIIVVISSCDNPFAPALINSDLNASQILTDQKTAEDVLINFSYAYNFKDSLVYSDLLDSSFLFISKNFATDPVTDLTWGRDVDLKTTGRMFQHFETINLVWDGTLSSFYLDQKEAYKEIRKTFKLTFDGGIDIPTLSGEALFVFQKKLINQADTSGIWRIIRWEDRSTF